MNNDITTLANQVKMALAHFACPPSVEVKNGEILIDGGSISICPDDRDQAVKTLRGRVNIESHGYSITVANAIPGLYIDISIAATIKPKNTIMIGSSTVESVSLVASISFL